MSYTRYFGRPSLPLSLATLASLALVLLLAPACRAAPLPRAESYQQTLRDYMATLTEDDFVIDLKPITYEEAYFKDIDTVARYWMLFLPASDIPPTKGICVPAKIFTLAAMEEGDNLQVSPGRAVFDPKDLAWWAQWDYPGNPYYGSKPLKLRAFVMAAADMMQIDTRGITRSDFLGGYLIRHAYTYRVTRDVVPKAASDAYAAGLIRLFEKLEKVTPRGPGGSDMEFFQLPAMWYAADALGGDFKARALARAHVVIDTITSKTGYEKHGGAFDASYQGIALRFLTWGASLYKDPKVNEALHKMLVLKSYLSLPEPGGAMVGPTHFNTGTGDDTPNDQWAWISRDYAMGMIDDMALYTIWSRSKVVSEADMRAGVKAAIQKLPPLQPVDAGPIVWKAEHWVNTLNFAYDQYRPGFYQRLWDLEKADSPLTKPLYSRQGNFIEDLNGGGEFLAAKFDDYAVILHTGATAVQWASGVSGKSGGSLSAFWTPAGGTALLGRCRATQSSTPDEWTDKNNRGPYTWAVNTITGRGKDGHYFSTARVRDFTSKYDIDGTRSAVVTITGDLAASKTGDPQDVLTGNVRYHREFHIDRSGVAVTSGLQTDGADAMPELWELLPVLTSPPKAQAIVELNVNGTWTAATETPATTGQIRITRYGAPVFVTLDTPRLVRINGKPDLYGRVNAHNVMIDLKGGKEPVIRYRITARQP